MATDLDDAPAAHVTAYRVRTALDHVSRCACQLHMVTLQVSYS